MTLFELKNVTYQNIISYPDLKIAAGEVTFICGESGSGKSTLLKLLNGIVSPTTGQITYSTENMNYCDPIMLRREILLVGQTVYLFDMSVKDNFKEFYSYRDLENISEDEMKMYLNICSVNFPLDNMCHIMSGGERQRIFIAINLSFQSKILMLDEPISALDDKNANILIENIKLYCNKNGKTLIVVSHDKAIAEKYADTIINLSGGEKK